MKILRHASLSENVSLHVQNVAYTGLILSDISILKKYMWKNLLRVTQHCNINYFVMLTISPDREQSRLSFDVLVTNIPNANFGKIDSKNCEKCTKLVTPFFSVFTSVSTQRFS